MRSGRKLIWYIVLGAVWPTGVWSQQAPQMAGAVWHRGGSGESEEVYFFTNISSLSIDPHGRIWVVDTQLPRIRVYDAAGQYVRSVGRRGLGPGEFGVPYSVGVTHDLVVVRDLQTQRYQVFDTAGVYRRTLEIDDLFHDRFRFPLATSANLVFDLRSQRDAPTQVGRDWILTYDPRSGQELARTLVRIDTPPSVGIPYDGDLILPVEVPYSPWFSWTVDRAGTIYWSHGGSYKINVQPVDGGAALERVAPNRLREVSGQDRADALEQLMDRRLRAFAESTGANVRPYLASLEEAMPSHWSEVLGLHADDEGDIWVEVPPPGPGMMALDRWSPTGQRRGTVLVPLPEGRRRLLVPGEALAIGGEMLVVALRGPYDESELHAFRLP